MFSQPPPEDYFDGFNEFLYRCVPSTAKRILEVGCSRARLGHELKKQDPERYVAGVEREPRAAEVARSRLDQVFVLDIQHEVPGIDKGSIDCILFGDVLEHLVDPEAALVALRELLTDDGIVLLSVPNVGHFTVIRELLRADFMYQPQGILDGTHLRFFTHATITKMMLDAGFMPSIEDVIVSPIKDDDIRAARPLLERLGLDPGRARKFLSAGQYIVKGTRLAWTDNPFAAEAITFVACSNDEQQLRSNLLRSPCLVPGTPHELLVMRECTSAAEGFHRGIEAATNDLIVFVQQDMYLPRGWDTHFVRGFAEAEARFAPLGIAGTFGIRYRDGDVEHIGRVVDRDKLLDMPAPLPAEVDGLDEIVLARRRSSPLSFDPALGFHLYGADICLAARERGLRSAVVEAPCFHNSLFSSLSPAFHRARELLLAKWPDVRPLITNMDRLDTLETGGPPQTWQDEQNSKLREIRRELDEIGRQLKAAQRRIVRMEASPFWRARVLAGKLARMTRVGRPKRRGDGGESPGS